MNLYHGLAADDYGVVFFPAMITQLLCYQYTIQRQTFTQTGKLPAAHTKQRAIETACTKMHKLGSVAIL